MNWRNMPVVRNHLTGDPVSNAVRPINRSEVVRRIFKAKGNISNGKVFDLLAGEGLSVSETVINTQRKKMFA